MGACADTPPAALGPGHLEQAVERLRQRDYPAALAAAERAVGADSNSVAARRVLGYLMMRAGQTDRALIHYNRALAVDSLSAAVHNDLACIYADRKQYNRALIHLDRAIALASDLAFLHYNLASLRQYMGQFRASEDAYNRALELAPDDGKMHRGLGILQLQEGRYDEAERHFTHARTANPRDKGARLGLAQVHVARGAHATAVEHYRAALALDPEYIEAQYGLVLAYAALGEREKSEAAQRTFAALGPLPHAKVRLVLSDPKRQYARGAGARQTRQGRAADADGASANAVFFVDVAVAAGIDFRHTNGAAGDFYLVETMGAGACFIDRDGDGWLDLYFADGHALPTPGAEQPENRLFRNRGGAFAPEPDQAADRGYGMGCAIADCDSDGRVDLYVTNFGANALYRNHEERLTHVAGVADDERWSSSAAFFDYDNDGDVDLYVANYLDFALARNRPCGNAQIRDYCDPKQFRGAPDALYRNDGAGFADVTRDAGVYDAGGKGLGVAVADYDDNGAIDLYVANDGTPNFLYRNRGDGTFAEEGLVSGTAYNLEGLAEAGMGTAFGDYDGDGRADVFVTNYAHETNTLYRNRGGGRFSDETASVGLGRPSLPYVGFGAHFFDYDNDGDDDLFVANGHIMKNIELLDDLITYGQSDQIYANEAGAYIDVSKRSGLARLPKRVGRGSAYGDYDQDGDLDVVVTNNNRPAALLRNEGGNRNHWLHIHLAGRALGAKVTVRAGGLTQARAVNAGMSYLSSSAAGAFIGLGRADSAEVVVRWPDGSTSDLGWVAANTRLVATKEDER